MLEINTRDKYTKPKLRVHYYVMDQTKDYELNLTFPVHVNISKKSQPSRVAEKDAWKSQ